jgi:hypothetical protein
MRNVYNILVGEPEGKVPLGLHRFIWEDNIKVNLGYVECEHVDWIKIGITFGPGNEPSSSVRGGEFVEPLSNYQLLEKDFSSWSYGFRFLVWSLKCRIGFMYT